MACLIWHGPLKTCSSGTQLPQCRLHVGLSAVGRKACRIANADPERLVDKRHGVKGDWRDSSRLCHCYVESKRAKIGPTMKALSKTPIPLFLIGLMLGLLPKVQAVVPPPDGAYSGFTTAEGAFALYEQCRQLEHSRWRWDAPF